MCWSISLLFFRFKIFLRRSTFMWWVVWHSTKVLGQKLKAMQHYLQVHVWQKECGVRKPDLTLRTTKAQTSLHIRAVWSAPLFFASSEVWYLKQERGQRTGINTIKYHTWPWIPITNGKVTNPQLDITNESQEVSPFPAVTTRQQ